jgi:type II secretory pathway component PulC
MAGEASAADPSVERVDDTRWVIDQSVIAAVAAEALLGEVALEKKGASYVLVRVPRLSWFESLDLRAGDEIVSVDGAAPEPGVLRTAVRGVAVRRELILTLRRAGTPLRHRYVLNTSPHALRSEIPRLAQSLEEIDLGRAIEQGIKKTGDGYEADTATLRALRVPMFDGGLPRGRQIDASPIALALGFTAYDEVKSVGDQDVGSAEGLVRELQAQAHRPEIAVVVSRLGEPTILRYRVVSGRVDEKALAAAVAAWDKAEEQRRGMAALSAAGAGASADTPVPTPHAEVVPAARENTYQVDQAALRKVLGNPMDMGLRVVPSVKNGRPNGFKLYAIRPSSIFAALGLRNGDTVHAVDGHDLSTMDRALEVYTAVLPKLKTDKRATIHVSISRRGQPVRLTYHLVPPKKAGGKK